MALIAPAYTDSRVGLSYVNGNTLDAAQMNELYANQRMERLRPLLSWASVGYGLEPSEGVSCVVYAPGIGPNGEQIPLWFSVPSAPVGMLYELSNFEAPAIESIALNEAVRTVEVFGCSYGGNAGLWISPHGGALELYRTAALDIGSPVHESPTSAVGLDGQVFSAAFRGTGNTARLLQVADEGGMWSADDGATWQTWEVADITGWLMGAASPDSWVFTTQEQLYRAANGAAAPTAISATNAALGVGNAVGVHYDISRGIYHVWGTTGHASSLDDGVTWAYDGAAPLDGAEIAAMGISTDGIIIAAVLVEPYPSTALYCSTDGSNWTYLSRITDSPVSGRIEYGGGRFAIPMSSGILVSGRFGL